MLSDIHRAAKMAISSKRVLGLAFLLATVSVPALAQDGTAPTAPAEVAVAVDAQELREEVAEIEREIAEAEAELAGYDGGLVVALIQARVETLKLTRAILENQLAAAGGGTVTEVTVPVAAPDAARAAEILQDIEAQMAVIRKAEAEAANAGGLVGALAVSRVLTEKLTLASLRGAWMTARYGSILPVDLPQGARVASPAPAAPSEMAGDDEPSGSAAADWADSNHPEIDYNTSIFTALADEYTFHGWWALQESRAEIDDSPIVFAVNLSAFEDTSFMPTNPRLTIACREGEASIIYDTDSYISGNYRSSTMTTTYRLDDAPAETEEWSKLTSSKGSGLFGSRGQAYLRKVYSAEKLFLRIQNDGASHDATFSLAGIQPVIDATAAACGFSLIELTRDDYRAIQTMLNTAGFNTGTPDGVWGQGSASAMRSWQEQNGLQATGAPDRASLEAMGIALGAE